MNSHIADQLVLDIQAMDRPALTEALLELEAPFPVDFSREFLEHWSLEKLRHVLFSAALHTSEHH